jgi:hypothetical protein
VTIPTLTLAEWRRWAETAGRNYTDPAIGATTKAKRTQNANASAAMTPPDTALWSLEARKRGAVLPDTTDTPNRSTGPRPREHGTAAGYRQHHSRDDLPACDECRRAHTVYRATHKRGSHT